MNVTIYLGASAGNRVDFLPAVRELGSAIAANGFRLVYGGSASGLMGELAKAALQEGGQVTGVEPAMFIEKHLQLEGLTELIVTEDLPSRKKKMIELGDAFIAFPGGTGTLDEISEILCLNALGTIQAPCIFYNLNGFYDPVRDLLDHMISCGLSDRQRQKNVFFADSVEDIILCLNSCKGENNENGCSVL